MIEERLAELGIILPPAPQPVASYIPVKVVGDLAWVAGLAVLYPISRWWAGFKRRRSAWWLAYF